MHHHTFILLLLFYSQLCVGQTTNNKIISDFKNDFLKKIQMYQPDTLRLDNQILIREKYPNVRVIKTFQKNKNVIYYDYYYNGTTQLQSTVTYDTLERP